MEIKLRFGVHKNNVQVYAISGKESKYKSVSVMLGKKKALRTDTMYWERDLQKFRHNIVGASEDNKILKGLMSKLKEFASSREFDSPADFFLCYEKEYLEVSAHVDKSVSLLEYAKTFRDMWKDGKVKGFENKSTNYQIYDKFINKLEGKVNREVMPWAKEAKRFANMPIASIEGKDFEAWAKFVVANGLDFRGSVNAFRAIIYNYRKNVLEDLAFRLPSVNHLNPKQKTEIKNFTFLDKEIGIIKTCDLSELKFKVKSLGMREMLRDVAVLIYGLYSRPCDVVIMRIEDLYFDKEKGCWYWDYCARKLANIKDSLPVPVKDEYAGIIAKYKGDRKKGFVFPFACNKEGVEWQKMEAGVNHFVTDAGDLLKAIAKAHKFAFKMPKAYTMRKTAITMLCAKGLPIHTIALLAKTSEKEIMSVYMDKTRVIKEVDLNNLL